MSPRPQLCAACGLSADAPIHTGGHPERCHAFVGRPKRQAPARCPDCGATGWTCGHGNPLNGINCIGGGRVHMGAPVVPPRKGRRMNTVHKLRCHPGAFLDIEEGRKTCEVRREDDRTFEVGDTLILQEWRPDSGGYTGRDLRALVTAVTKFAGNLRLVLRDTYGLVSAPAVVMSIAVRRDP